MTDCQHHWVIETPDGPTSPGTCQKCGQTGDFYNYINIDKWDAAHVRTNPTVDDKREAEDDLPDIERQ